MTLTSKIHQYSRGLEKIILIHWCHKKIDHANCVGVKATSLPLITEHLAPKIVVISGLHPIKCSVLSFDYMTTEPPVIHSHQATTNISGRGQGDQNVPLVSLKSHPDVRRGGISPSGNFGIGVNPHGTIRGNGPQGTGQRVFNVFISTTGIKYFSNSSTT